MLMSLDESYRENTKEVRYQYEQGLVREGPLCKNQIQAAWFIQ